MVPTDTLEPLAEGLRGYPQYTGRGYPVSTAALHCFLNQAIHGFLDREKGPSLVPSPGSPD